MEQRHRAVLEVMEGLPVTEVSGRYGVTRQTVHRWLRWYAQGGIAALADGSRRPATCPHRMAPEVEARIVALRSEHPGWGPRTLLHYLGCEGLSPLPGRSSVHRCLLQSLVSQGWYDPEIAARFADGDPGMPPLPFP